MLSACLLIVMGYSVFGAAQACTELADADRRLWAVFAFLTYLIALAGAFQVLHGVAS